MFESFCLLERGKPCFHFHSFQLSLACSWKRHFRTLVGRCTLEAVHKSWSIRLEMHCQLMIKTFAYFLTLYIRSNKLNINTFLLHSVFCQAFFSLSSPSCVREVDENKLKFWVPPAHASSSCEIRTLRHGKGRIDFHSVLYRRLKRLLVWTRSKWVLLHRLIDLTPLCRGKGKRIK